MTFSAPIVKTRRVAITAAGIVSPLGIGLDRTLDSLRQSRDCVTPVTRFPLDQCRCQTAGQIDDEPLYETSRLPDRQARRLHRSSHMVIAAMREALGQDRTFQPQTTIFGTTSGGMSFGEQYYRSIQAKIRQTKIPEWIANYPPQKPVLAGLEALNLACPCQVIANACASGTNAIGHAFDCIRSGGYDRVLTGGYDAISELVFVGFDSLQASTPEKCRPFDAQRSGMVLGEGAAVLTLEEMDSAVERGAPIIGEIAGYGISTDNHHLTQPDPSGIGPRRAMEQALGSAGIEPGGVDYINAHGTATPFNDAAEGRAISDLFGTGVPVSSTKAMMGHSLGAAGAIEAVLCLLAMQNDLLPGNLHFRTPDEGLALDIVANGARPKKLRNTLSNSFGFGGTNASIVLRGKPRE